MSDNTPSWFKKTQAKASHTAAISATENSTQSPKSQPLGATDMLSASLWIQGDDGQGRVVNYSHIEEIDTDANRGRLRLFLPRSVVDITTENMSELVTLLGRRKLATLATGQVNESITVDTLTIYSRDKMPQAPQNAIPPSR